MGVIVIYTHTDMEDVWVPFFGQNKKYLQNYKKYICLNKPTENVPNEYIPIYYDEFKPYTERLKECISQINEEVFLFMHEDMILYSEPKHNLIQKYFEYVKEQKVNSVKLIYANDASEETTSSFDKNLVQNDYSKFSIQPTIISKSYLIGILNGIENLNIWDFENAIICNHMDFSVRLGSEPKRGFYHYDSLIFPYIATAINKGNWNMTEYPVELNSIFEEYEINPFNRGII